MTTDPPPYAPFPVRGRGPEGAFDVSIYAKDQAVAEAEYAFRYKTIGCVPLSSVIGDASVREGIFGPQPVDDYRVAKKAGNSVRVLPPVGKAFTKDQWRAMKMWAEEAGWTAILEGQVMIAIAPEFEDGAWRGFPRSGGFVDGWSTKERREPATHDMPVVKVRKRG